jgi:hypothetical protein
MDDVGIFYGHLVYFPVLVCCKKNLATLLTSAIYRFNRKKILASRVSTTYVDSIKNNPLN